MASRVFRPIVRFARDTAGSVIIEGLYMILLLIFFILAMLVYTDVFTARNTSVKATYTVADLLSRWNSSTLAVDKDYLDGMNELYAYMAKVDTTDTELRITSAYYNKDTKKYVVDWSYKTHNGTKLTSAMLNEPDYTSRLPNLVAGEYVIILESEALYSPPFRVGIPDMTFEEFVVTRPRFVPRLPLES